MALLSLIDVMVALGAVFLSLVDLVTPRGSGINSSAGKCWGYYDITVGSFRFIYQDFRRDHFGDCEFDVLSLKEGR